MYGTGTDKYCRHLHAKKRAYTANCTEIHEVVRMGDAVMQIKAMQPIIAYVLTKRTACYGIPKVEQR